MSHARTLTRTGNNRTQSFRFVNIHASLTETFGNVLTEAMASGLAVCGFDYAAARQFVKNGDSGLSMPVDRPDEFIAASVRLATDPALRLRLRAAARLAVEAQSWESVIADFESNLRKEAGLKGPLKRSELIPA